MNNFCHLLFFSDELNFSEEDDRFSRWGFSFFSSDFAHDAQNCLQNSSCITQMGWHRSLVAHWQRVRIPLSAMFSSYFYTRLHILLLYGEKQSFLDKRLISGLLFLINYPFSDVNGTNHSFKNFL